MSKKQLSIFEDAEKRITRALAFAAAAASERDYPEFSLARAEFATMSMALRRFLQDEIDAQEKGAECS